MANMDEPQKKARKTPGSTPPPVAPPPVAPPTGEPSRAVPPPISPPSLPPPSGAQSGATPQPTAGRRSTQPPSSRSAAARGPQPAANSSGRAAAGNPPAAKRAPASAATGVGGGRLTLKAALAARRANAKAAQPAPVDSVDAITPETAEPEEDLKEVAIKAAPPWLISLVVHTVGFIVLGLLYVARIAPPVISLNATYAESIGVQLEDDTLDSNSMDLNDVVEPVFSVDMMPSNDPLASPPDIDRSLRGLMATDTVNSPSIGIALTGREPGMKKALLAAYGGNATTEAAVGRALEWLKRNQRRDGMWSLTGPFSAGAFDENQIAATAMALLAFQGAGHTHEAGKYQEEVRKGWRALLKQQDRDGNFFREGQADQRLYSQAQAMIALCEIYGMTKDSMFKGPAQKAVNYAVDIQAPEGGWRYRPRIDSDTSVTGWFVMGLQSALMAGLDVPSPTLQRISEFLDTVAMYDGAYYKYQPVRQGFTPAMTAEGLLCRQYLGWKHDDPRLREGIELLLENPIDWDDKNSYYWYYATQVLHHMEGEPWDTWNRVMRQSVPEHQVRGGAEDGSWDPDGDRWGHYGGRLYQTCLCAYMLEVYYRHLPIYSYRLD